MTRPRWRIGVAVLGFVLLGAAAWSALSAQPASGRAYVHFIDVGQADAVLITNESRTCTMLIDSGDTRYPDSASSFKAYLSRHLPAGSQIDLAIASHPHSDHIGSMQWVLETYRVKTYVDNGQAHSSKLYHDLMAVVRQQAQQALAYHPYERFPSHKEAICGATGPRVQVLHPQAGLDADVCEKNQNNCSVVARLSVGGTRFLFPGDAEHEEEELLLGDPSVRPQLAAEVLKVGHHGSDTSSGDAFLDAVNPSWMVVSAGAKDVGTNKGYKHPRWQTVRELLAFAGPRESARAIDAYDGERKQWRRPRIWGRLYVTAKDGTVVLSSNGSDIRKE